VSATYREATTYLRDPGFLTPLKPPSQCLLMDTLANFTLSKRREILEKSSVNEILQDSLLRSPLSDKIFGLSLQKIQEEVNKTPQFLRVNVQLTNGKRETLLC
jgi:hypothetical protein